MKRELQKKMQDYQKIIDLLESTKFSVGLGMGSVLLTILASFIPYLSIGDFTFFSVVGRPLLLGGLGISTIFLSIPVSKYYQRKYQEIASKLNKIKKRNNSKNKKRSNYIKEEKKINKKAEIFINSSKLFNFINPELELEWEQYLNNTIIDDASINFVKSLFYYLNLLNSKEDIAEIISIFEEQKVNSEIIDLLIHFSIKGDILNDAWSLKYSDGVKRKRKN